MSKIYVFFRFYVEKYFYASGNGGVGAGGRGLATPLTLFLFDPAS